jgi:preprotein translocase subunit SecF
MEQTIKNKKRIEDYSEKEFKQLINQAPQTALTMCVGYFTTYISVTAMMMLVLFAGSENLLALIVGISFFYGYTSTYAESLRVLATYQDALDDKHVKGRTPYESFICKLIRTIAH